MKYYSSHHRRNIVVAVDELDVPVVEGDSQDAHPVGWAALGERHQLLPLLHVELLAVPLEVPHGDVGAEGDLVDDVAVQVHYDDAPLCGAHVDLLIIRGPGPRSEARLRGQHGGPVPLSRH